MKVSDFPLGDQTRMREVLHGRKDLSETMGNRSPSPNTKKRMDPALYPPTIQNSAMINNRGMNFILRKSLSPPPAFRPGAGGGGSPRPADNLGMIPIGSPRQQMA